MRVLFDIGHPGHVHLFKNAAADLQRRGDQVVFAIRDRPLVGELLQHYGFDYHIASNVKTGLLGQMYELVEHDWHVLRLAQKHHCDLLVGTSVAVAHASRLCKAKSIVFNEDDFDYTKLFARITYPFSDVIAIPEILRDRKTSKHRCHNSYHELAYLHEDNFTPDKEVLNYLDVGDEEDFFLLRLVSFKAYHDVGHEGINKDMQLKLIELLSTRGKVFITMEGDLPAHLQPYKLPIPPHLIHHALSFASMLICDSQTMTLEAAVLGTPAIRYNTFVGLCSVIEEIEQQYELAFGFRPGQENEFFAKIEELISDPQTASHWSSKRERLLRDKVDLNKWMLDLFDQVYHTDK